MWRKKRQRRKRQKKVWCRFRVESTALRVEMERKIGWFLGKSGNGTFGVFGSFQGFYGLQHLSKY